MVYLKYPTGVYAGYTEVIIIEKYNVTGMSCAACQSRVEKAVSAVNGVTSCSVSLLTNTLGVEGSASSREIIKAVEKAGYGASIQGSKQVSKKADYDYLLKDRETPLLRRRLIRSAAVLLMLMYISMGHGMLGFYLPKALSSPSAIGTLQMLLAVIVMMINRKFFTSGFRALVGRSPNMDTLVAMGSAASFVYSLVSLFMIFYYTDLGMQDKAVSIQMDLYFETAAMIPTLITVGKLLEAVSKGRTTDALKSLMRIAPVEATVIRNGEQQLIPIEEVEVGDIIAVKPGENIPVDAIITEGETSVDESALTGETIPADKQVGSRVYAATINSSGYFLARATQVGEDTTLSKIISLVSDAAATKAPIARIADKVSAVFVPAVMGISLLTFIIWTVVGKGFSFSIARAISVLVISCPCALGLATPVAIMAASGIGAKNAILFKNAASIENAGKISVCALDKTGTVTEGKPVVTDVMPLPDTSQDELLKAAVSIEAKSEHPLAKAINEYGKQKGIEAENVTSFKSLTGSGVCAVINGKTVLGGSISLIDRSVGIKSDVKEKCEKLSAEGKTPLLFSENGKLLGMIAVADTIKEDSKKAITELINMGITPVMITGDNKNTAAAIADQAGIKEIIAGVLPDGKEKAVRQLSANGSVAMVGDGINDAPALVRANVGIAIGAGTDIAIDAADIVVMKSRLTDVSAAVRLSRAAVRNIHENLFWAFFYNVICIPLAAGFYSALFGLDFEMNPMVGAAAMSVSSFTVCMNALRLNLLDIHSDKKDKKISYKSNSIKKENVTMKKTITIEGMMCGHCEATVKKALEALDGVASADVSHEKGTAVIELNADVADDILKKAVEDKDFTVKGIA